MLFNSEGCKQGTALGFASFQFVKEGPQTIPPLQKSNWEVRPPLGEKSSWEELLIGVVGCLVWVWVLRKVSGGGIIKVSHQVEVMHCWWSLHVYVTSSECCDECGKTMEEAKLRVRHVINASIGIQSSSIISWERQSYLFIFMHKPRKKLVTLSCFFKCIASIDRYPNLSSK